MNLHQPKPRLGDYYAGLSHREFFDVYFTRKPKWAGIAYLVFRTSESDGHLNTEVIAVASDAFAFGAVKYGVGCWREVSSDEHLQGAGRHFEAWLKDPQSKDDESGLLHEAHFLARAIMCLEQRRVGK